MRIELGAVQDRCLHGDSTLLEDAVLNLVRNAVKFSPPEGVVRVEAGERTDGTYGVRVIDQGPGIPAEMLGEVTRPFVQADIVFSRNHEGMGVGLYLTRSFLDLHGGGVELDSPTGGGTIATAWLPAERIAERAAHLTGSA